jgi:hypothetical protein
MRRIVILSFALLLALVPAARAAEPHIAPGVSAGGTDLSGLTLSEAAARLYATHTAALGRPLSTHVAGRAFPLAPAAVKFSFDGLRRPGAPTTPARPRTPAR